MMVLIHRHCLEVHGRISPCGKLLLQFGPHVVVCHGSPEVGLHGATIGQEVAAAHGVGLEPTRLFIKDNI